jgi:hypothetical protein
VPAVDHDARIRADIARLIGLDDIGFNVAWDLLPVQVPGANKPMVTHLYRIVLTKRQLLGQPDLDHMWAGTGGPQGPSEAELAKVVKDGIAELHRKAQAVHDEAISGANGHGRPGG